MRTTTDFYLLYTLDLPLGGLQDDSPDVRLYGGMQITGGEFRFNLSRDTLPVKLLADGEVTSEISEPLGLKGVVLDKFDLAGRVYKDSAGATSVDLALEAEARFTSSSLSQFKLTGAIVVDDGAPRLAMAMLSATPPLTLTQFLNSVFQGTMAWAGDITDQFAFMDGAIYYLKAPDKAPDKYTYTYDNVAYQPGYGVASKFLIFGKYEIDISLIATGHEFDLTTSSPTSINAFDFVTLNNLSIEISSRSSNTHIQADCTLNFFNSKPDLKVSLDYDTGQKLFKGHVSADLGTLSLPGDGGNSDHHVSLDVAFTWGSEQDNSGNPLSGLDPAVQAKRGFHLTSINGLPTMDFDLIGKFTDLLNKSGGCNKIVSDWLNGLTTTKLTPGLNGSPTKDDDGNMIVPLKVTYSVLVGGSSIADETITFTATLVMPHGLSELPIKIFQSIVESLPTIAADILGNVDTYKAIAMEIAKRGGASAFARMICRALEKALEDLAKDLAKAAESVACETIEIAAELAAALISVAMLSAMKLITNLFEKAWDEIKSWFHSGGSDKDKARDKIREAQANVEAAVQKVEARIDEAKVRISASKLTTTLDPDGNIETRVVWTAAESAPSSLGGQITCHLQYLSGVPGYRGQKILVDVPDAAFPDERRFEDVARGADYRMNAALRTKLAGFTFMTGDTEKQITDGSATLRGLKDEVADEFATKLDGILTRFKGYNASGVESDWIYATTDVPAGLVVGNSRIGQTTRITLH
jgi:hypothetical protein